MSKIGKVWPFLLLTHVFSNAEFSPVKLQYRSVQTVGRFGTVLKIRV